MEVWKVIESFPNYEVSTLGRVRRTKEYHQKLKGKKDRLMTYYCLDKKQYIVNLTKDRRVHRVYVFRLVVTAFIGEYSFDKKIEHINGDTKDNRLENLKCVPYEGAKKMIYKDGVKAQYRFLGEYNKRVKLKPHDVIEIKKEILKGTKLGLISKKFNISSSIVWHIANNRTWKHVKIED